MPRKKTNDEKNSIRQLSRYYDIDIIKTYEKLKCFSEIPINKIRDKHVLIDAINKAPNIAFHASVIYNKAKKEKELFLIEFNKKMNELSKAAISRIQSWFEATDNVKKQITKDMVINEICSHDVDSNEYRVLIKEREELEEIENNLKFMMNIWRDRQSGLQTQAGLLKEQKEVILGSRKE